MKKNKQWPPKITHSYVIYAACGCPVCVIADVPGLEKETAKEIASNMRAGGHVERKSHDELKPILENLGCSCKKERQLQMRLP